MKIYTKTGDQGQTKLVDGSCVEKFNSRVKAYGTIDELNSQIGVLISVAQNSKIFEQNLAFLTWIQHQLFITGSIIAASEESILQHLPKLEIDSVTKIETAIDQLTHELPKLTEFILPGGSILSAHSHVARTVCRRAEREVAESIHNQKADSLLECQNLCLIFLNRLSDYLFTLSRWFNIHLNVSEVVWKK